MARVSRLSGADASPRGPPYPLPTLIRVRAYAGLLAESDYRRLWLAQSISQVGTQVTQLALPFAAILVLKATPFEVAALTGIEFLPYLLFALPAGVWADRLPRRRILVVADVGRALVLVLVPLATFADLLAMWQLYVVGFLIGTLSVFFDVAYQAILPDIVARDRLQEGNSRLEISRSAAQVIGPALGGTLVGWFTAPLALLADAISYVGSAACLIGLRTSSRRSPVASARPAPATDAPMRSGSLRGEIVEGLKFYRASPLLLASSAAIVSANVGGSISGAIFLVYLVRELGLTPELIGIAGSIGSLGLLAGAATASAFARRVGVGPTLAIALALAGVATLLLVVASTTSAFGLLVASGILQGYAVMLINVNGVSLRQALTPDHLQGRVNATGRWINWSLIPAAGLLGGVVATIVGLRFTIAIGALVSLLALPVVLISPLRTLRELPEHPPGDAPRDAPGARPTPSVPTP